MKVIIVYSGKGGVGKTTTTANITKSLLAQGEKVFILDADVNTPSMPVIFPQPIVGEKLMVSSLGYATKSTIYVTDSAIRSFIKESIDEINEFKPDYVLIDTPPSITDVHINLLDKIKPSGLIVVTQPNALSVSDINRTVLFFKEKNVNIIGIVENMCTKVKSDNTYNWKLIESIPFNSDFDNVKAYEENKARYRNITNILKQLDTAILENKKLQFFDESITIEDIESLPYSQRNDLHFFNLKTWDYVRNLLQDQEGYVHPPDLTLSFNDSERIGRMLKSFENDEQAYFMVSHAPSCIIQLLPGEIGQGTLHIDKSHYGIPRIKYSTLQGDIVLFPHEIIPVNHKDLIKWVGSEGYVPTKDGRYLPPKEELIKVRVSFGKRVGLIDKWEELYDNIMCGNLPQINQSPTTSELQENKGKGHKYRKNKVIGDILRFKNNPYM